MQLADGGETMCQTSDGLDSIAIYIGVEPSRLMTLCRMRKRIADDDEEEEKEDEEEEGSEGGGGGGGGEEDS